MAEKIKIAELEVDDKKLLDSITRTKKAIDDLSESQKDLKKAGDTSSETFVQQEAKLKELRGEYGRQIKVLQATSKSQLDLDKEMKKNVKSIKDATDNNRELIKIRNQLNASTEEGAQKIAEINKRIDQNNAFIKKNTSEVEQNRQGVGGYKQAIIGAIKSVKAFSLALKSAGIGLIVAGLVALKDAFSQNQKVADFFATTGRAVSLVLRDIVNFIVDNFSVITDFFDNPAESVKNLGQAIKDNIIERFNSALESITLLGGAIKAVFEGEFDKALELAKASGKEFVDVLTGVDNSVDRITTGVSNYASEIVATAQAQTQLNKSVQIAIAENEKLLQQYDNEAEKARQQRDNIRLSYEERLAGSARLKEVLEEQERLQLANANLAIQEAQANLALNDTTENRIALLEAETRQQDVLATVQGFRTEQLEQQNALEDEIAQDRADRAQKELELTREFGDRKRELENEIARQRQEDETLREELRVEQEFEKQQEELARLELNETQKAELEALLLERKQQQLQEIREKDAEDQIKLSNEIKKERIDAQQQVLDSAIEIAGQESALGKSLLLVKKALAIQEFFIEQKKAKAEALLKAKQATADIASGTAKTSASVPFPFNIPLIAGYIAQTVGLVSTIIGAVKGGGAPKFAQGGILSGASHANGGIPTPYGELEGGEAVINKRSTALFKPLLSRINEAGGGKKFASGGILGEEVAIGGQFTDIDQLADKIAKANSRLPAPRVAVDEISRVASDVQVIESEATF